RAKARLVDRNPPLHRRFRRGPPGTGPLLCPDPRRTIDMFADPQSLTEAERESGSVFAPKFDSNGLVTAITVETGTNQILMVAHMRAEALAETLRSGYATYWSRSRGKRWKKGESSGELQELVEMRTDCDQDAIVLTVRQTGHGAA